MIDESNVSLTKTKHFGWIIFAFAGGGAIALGLVVCYALGLFTHVSEFRSVDIVADEQVNYRDGVYLNLYFDDNELVANVNTSNAMRPFSEALRDAYKVTDPVSRYDDCVSISYLNDAVGEDVNVGPRLYGILKEAYGYSTRENNYSVFAAPLHEEWKLLCNYHLTVSETEIDPSVDLEEKALLEQISSYIYDESHVKLTFKDDNVVRLDVSEQYKTFRTDNAITAPIVSLNTLRNAYEALAVKEAMEAKGYTYGYISTERGYGIALSNLSGLGHALHAPQYRDYVATLGVSGAQCYAKYNRFYAYGTENFYNYYTVGEGEDLIYRSHYVNLSSGLADDTILSSYLFEEGNDLVKLAIAAERSAAVTSKQALTSYVNSLGSNVKCAFLCKDDPSTFLVQESLQSTLSIRFPEAIHSKTI